MNTRANEVKQFLLNFNVISVADSGFPRGSANLLGAPTYYLTNFSLKLHENEEILRPLGPLDLPLDVEARCLEILAHSSRNLVLQMCEDGLQGVQGI